MKRRTQSGFTLAEVMIALLIFALIAAASVYALRLGVDSRNQLGAADETLKRLQIARTLIKEDLAQIAPRSVRDQFGIGSSPMFTGGQITIGSRVQDDEKVLMSFVRGGWINPQAKAPRSALQHVEYVFKDGRLIRRAWAYLDEAEKTQETMERVLFDDLDNAEAQFFNGEFRGELQWADAWPVGGGKKPPAAVALLLRKGDGEPLRQLFWIGDLGAQL